MRRCNNWCGWMRLARPEVVLTFLSRGLLLVKITATSPQALGRAGYGSVRCWASGDPVAFPSTGGADEAAGICWIICGRGMKKIYYFPDADKGRYFRANRNIFGEGSFEASFKQSSYWRLSPRRLPGASRRRRNCLLPTWSKG